MAFELPASRGPVRDLAVEAGHTLGYALQAIGALVVSILRFRLSITETLNQIVFIGRVSTGPSLLLMIPVGVFIAVSVGELAGRIGAGGYSGAVVAFVIVGQAAALVCALMMAGVAGSAICTDLGSRKIREEIDAMEVLGINPIQRLVVPRVLAMILVAILLNGLVAVIGIAGGYFFNVVVQGGTPGAYLASFGSLAQLPDLYISTVKAAIFGVIAGVVAAYKGLNPKGGPKGVGDAVNQSVVITFLLLFFANLILTAVYLQVVPPKGA